MTERAGRKLAIAEKDTDYKTEKRTEKILVPLTNNEGIGRLIDLALILKNPKSNEPLYPLSIVEDDSDADEKLNGSGKLLDTIAEQVAAMDKKLEVLKKVDLNIVDGIVRTARAYTITDIVLAYQTSSNSANFIFGSKADQLVSKADQFTVVSKILQPFNTFKKVVVLLTPNAELEKNFKRTCIKINRILKQVGEGSIVYGVSNSIEQFKNLINDKNSENYDYMVVDNFENFDFLDKYRSDDNLYLILNSRKQTVSYDYHIDNLPKELHKSFEYTSFIVLYPEMADVNYSTNEYIEVGNIAMQENLDKIMQVKDKVKEIFKRDSQS